MDTDRAPIDPDGRYPADGLRVVEQHAARIKELLPRAEMERTRDVFQFCDGGDEEAIVLVVSREALEIRHPRTEWTRGAYGPAASSCLWRRRKWASLKSAELPELIASARRARKRQFRRCRFCGGRFPPEHRIEDDVCHGCASSHLGVTF